VWSSLNGAPAIVTGVTVQVATYLRRLRRAGRRLSGDGVSRNRLADQDRAAWG
jgi:hypothetical protein